MRTSHDAVLRQGAYRLYARGAGGGQVKVGAADGCLPPPPADPGASDRPDRGRDRRGTKTPRRCSDDRGGAYLYVGAGRRQAWRDDVHQPLYRHVPRQSGGAGAFPVHGARAAALTLAWSLGSESEPRLDISFSRVFFTRTGDHFARKRYWIRKDCPCPHPQISTTLRKGSN